MEEQREATHLPQTVEELEKQIDWYDRDDLKLDRLRELVREYRDRFDDWDGYRDLLKSAQTLQKQYEGAEVGLPYPVICSEEEFHNYIGKGQPVSREWIQWLLSNLYKDKETKELSYRRWVIRKACFELDKQGLDSSDLEWQMMGLPEGFKEFLQEQHKWIQDSPIGESEMRPSAKSNGECFKIHTTKDLSKLADCFGRMFTKGWVDSDASALIRSHFSNGEEEPVPKGTPLINWLPASTGRRKAGTKSSPGPAKLREFLKYMGIPRQEGRKHFTVGGEASEKFFKQGGTDRKHQEEVEKFLSGCI
jgi:hypothetical protein